MAAIRRQRLRFLWFPVLVFLVGSMAAVSVFTLGEEGEGGVPVVEAVRLRKLLGGGGESLLKKTLGPTCDSPLDLNGGAFWYFLLCLYCFLGLAIICDDYFVESLESISNALNLSEDVAGATFMAAGSSAPELMTSLMTVLVTKSQAGLGTIVGSAIFNILVIVGLTCLMAGRALEIAWYPLTRDSVFYVLSVAGLVGAMSDGKIWYWEGILLVIGYLLYIVYMKFNSNVLNYIESRSKKVTVTPSPHSQEGTPDSAVTSVNDANNSADMVQPMSDMVEPIASADTHAIVTPRKDRLPAIPTGFVAAQTDEPRRMSLKDPLQLSGDSAPEDKPKRESECEDQKPEAGVDDCDDGEFSCVDVIDETTKATQTLEIIPKWRIILAKTFDVIQFPLATMLRFTVPKCGEEKWQRWYFVTFFMSILWIALFTFFMVDFAERFGLCLNIPDHVMGLLVLAAGTSVPDALSSILVARQGQGDMAIANALGSNVFDVLLGLGFPWMIGAALEESMYIEVNNEDINVNIVVLFVSLFIFVGSLVVSKWTLSPKLGIALFCGYILYAAWTILTQVPLMGDGLSKHPVIQIYPPPTAS